MANISSDEYQALLAKFKALPEQDRYDLWSDLWDGVHRRTFAQVKPIEQPASPAAPPPAGAGVMPPLPTEEQYLREITHDSHGEERLLPLPRLIHVPTQRRMEPMLRLLKQPLYDKLIVPEDGHVGLVSLFSDCRWFPNHTPKSLKDTNMTCDGTLGFPLEYDLRWIDLKFEKFAHPDDLKRVLRGLTFKWVRGQTVPWLRVTLSGFEPYLAKDDLALFSDDAVRRLLAAYDGENKWTRFRVSVLTPDGEPQRIGSTESFRVEIEGNLGELHGPVHLKVLLGDTLCAAI